MERQSQVPVLTDQLDAAEGQNATISGCVRIPLIELPDRMHELPHPDTIIKVVRNAAPTIAFLESRGRRAIEAEAIPSHNQTRLWSPNPFLEETAKELSPGKALDIACGSGRDSVYLAAHGWEVQAVDWLADALDRAKDLERRYSTGPGIQWTQTDLNKDGLTKSKYDLVFSFFYLDRKVFAEAIAQIAPEGSLILESFTEQHRTEFGKPKDKERVWQPGEIADFAQQNGLKIEIHKEELHHGRHTARLWATKPEVPSS
ncbi:hypothetical protein BH11ARM1_BH11ARM1_00800 [soil metagenome]